MERKGTVYVYPMHACIYVHARLATPTNGMRARRTHAPTCCVRARARMCVCDLARKHPCRHMRARSVGVDRVRFGSQAFQSVSGFNADIGAWNTASVTTLYYVFAAVPARRQTHTHTQTHRHVYMYICIYVYIYIYT